MTRDTCQVWGAVQGPRQAGHPLLSGHLSAAGCDFLTAGSFLSHAVVDEGPRSNLHGLPQRRPPCAPSGLSRNRMWAPRSHCGTRGEVRAQHLQGLGGMTGGHCISSHRRVLGRALCSRVDGPRAAPSTAVSKDALTPHHQTVPVEHGHSQPPQQPGSLFPPSPGTCDPSASTARHRLPMGHCRLPDEGRPGDRPVLQPPWPSGGDGRSCFTEAGGVLWGWPLLPRRHSLHPSSSIPLNGLQQPPRWPRCPCFAVAGRAGAERCLHPCNSPLMPPH